MTTVQETMDQIEAQSDYVSGSLIVKNADDRGLVLKWLILSGSVAERKELFVELNQDESYLDITKRTTISTVEVEPAGN